MMKIDIVVDYLWTNLYNEYSINGVLIISRENFSQVMERLVEEYLE